MNPALKRRTRLLLLLPVRATLALSACSEDADDVPASTSDALGAVVNIENFEFHPDPLTVDAGTTVTFVNGDEINHSVTSGSRGGLGDDFAEGVMVANGDEVELRFDEPGTYEYFCRFHPGDGMSGQVVVE